MLLFIRAFEDPVEVKEVIKGNQYTFITIPLEKYYQPGRKIKGLLVDCSNNTDEYITTRGYSWSLPGKDTPEVTIKLDN